jgi:hypothetical protein
VATGAGHFRQYAARPTIYGPGFHFPLRQVHPSTPARASLPTATRAAELFGFGDPPHATGLCAAHIRMCVTCRELSPPPSVARLLPTGYATRGYAPKSRDQNPRRSSGGSVTDWGPSLASEGAGPSAISATFTHHTSRSISMPRSVMV